MEFAFSYDSPGGTCFCRTNLVKKKSYFALEKGKKLLFWGHYTLLKLFWPMCSSLFILHSAPLTNPFPETLRFPAQTNFNSVPAGGRRGGSSEAELHRCRPLSHSSSCTWMEPERRTHQRKSGSQISDVCDELYRLSPPRRSEGLLQCPLQSARCEQSAAVCDQWDSSGSL